MPDISMCQNQTCPVKEECYRFMATPNPYRQSYAAFKVTSDKGCENKMRLYPDEVPKRKDPV